MTVLLTLTVGLLTAIAACLGAGVVAAVCVSWYHITSREGASGYFVVAMALLGLVGGAVIGIVCARVVAARPSPTFLAALGLSFGVTLGLLLLIAGFAWLGADFPPKIEGKELVVEFEIRLPEGVAPPSKEDVAGLRWSATITADHGSRSQRIGGVEADKATKVEGRWVVPATVFLHTSNPGKSLGVVLGNDFVSQFFDLRIGARPTHVDMSWTPWMTEPHFGNLTPVPPKDAIAVRYRVQYYVEPPPPPPVPSQEELEAKAKAERDAAFAALTPESPLDAWLSFTRYG
ncbi:MAG TPA: hypothetical protein VGR00_08900, partial [Thermoanaerobaculia bacterium]|nr:hypothetical protein [Thermoanaerobaculia bacterium]